LRDGRKFSAEEEPMSVTAPLAPYRVIAFNTAHDSENKIHDDATARRFGFGGGLVPGVDVYGYMTHLPVMRWGRAWLERGTAECRFFKPVYDGDTATVTATEAACCGPRGKHRPIPRRAAAPGATAGR
jgi:acyl dehydratase